MTATAPKTTQPATQAARPVKRAMGWRTTELGPEKFCARCNEWWPADLEFFFANPHKRGGLFYCCKACYGDWQRANRASRASTARAQMEPTA